MYVYCIYGVAVLLYKACCMWCTMESNSFYAMLALEFLCVPSSVRTKLKNFLNPYCFACTLGLLPCLCRCRSAETHLQLPTLCNIDILHDKQAKLPKHLQHSVFIDIQIIESIL